MNNLSIFGLIGAAVVAAIGVVALFFSSNDSDEQDENVAESAEDNEKKQSKDFLSIASYDDDPMSLGSANILKQMLGKAGIIAKVESLDVDDAYTMLSNSDIDVMPVVLQRIHTKYIEHGTENFLNAVNYNALSYNSLVISRDTYEKHLYGVNKIDLSDKDSLNANADIFSNEVYMDNNTSPDELEKLLIENNLTKFSINDDYSLNDIRKLVMNEEDIMFYNPVPDIWNYRHKTEFINVENMDKSFISTFVSKEFYNSSPYYVLDIIEEFRPTAKQLEYIGFLIDDVGLAAEQAAARYIATYLPIFADNSEQEQEDISKVDEMA